MKNDTFNGISFSNKQKWNTVKHIYITKQKIFNTKKNIRLLKNLSYIEQFKTKALLIIKREIEFHENRLENYINEQRINFLNLTAIKIWISRYTSQY